MSVIRRLLVLGRSTGNQNPYEKTSIAELPKYPGEEHENAGVLMERIIDLGGTTNLEKE